MAFLDPSHWSGKIYSDGWQDGGGGDAAVFEPATGKVIGRYGVASPDDLSRAATRAADAGKQWAALSFDARVDVLRNAAQLIDRYADDIEHWLQREAGSSRGKARAERQASAARFWAAANLASLPYGRLLRSRGTPLSFAHRVPVGTVGVIAPFNFPLLLAVRSVAPALALGNAVILKPDPRTCVSGGLLLAAIMRAAGLPDGVLHVLPAGAAVGAALVEHPLVPVISFTGSTRGGRAVGQAAAKHFKRVHLELGGNNAMLVLDDVDVERAAAAACWGSFLHQGQICMTTGRHLVHESVYDAYVQRLGELASNLTLGDGACSDAALGPIIDAQQRDRIHAMVTDAVDNGARLVTGGSYEQLFYRPTVLADMRSGWRAFEEEIFGPVAPVMKFSSIEAAVDIVNASDYGLSLSILSRDAMRALRVAKRMRSGSVHINDQTVGANATSPTGGVGASGNGARFGGPEADMEAFTDTQWVTIEEQIPRYSLMGT